MRILVLVICLLIAGESHAQPSTLRSGSHLLTLQWIGSEKPGKATITPAGKGLFAVKGEQRNASGDFLTIEGTLRMKSARELVFEGVILSQVSYVNQGKPCEKKGQFTFYAKGTRKYWRLQQMANCEGGAVTDYVDLFF
jgi:hypothetical protein